MLNDWRTVLATSACWPHRSLRSAGWRRCGARNGARSDAASGARSGARVFEMVIPHSPGMTIGTTAWMENEWLQTVQPEAREVFAAKRYMDDLLVFYAENPRWDHQRLLSDLTSECYFPPLKLADGSEGTFLETSFKVTPCNQICTGSRIRMCGRRWFGDTRISRATRLSVKSERY